jgi:rare lipoprotein A
VTTSNTYRDKIFPGHFLFLLTQFVLFITVFSGCSGQRGVRTDVPYERKTVVASWYGKDFHGRPTSSGEIFDMHGRTCAHKEYPFGTLLTVTNPANNKAVECTVNDRGPFVAGRDLDLSYGAAREIGLIGRGTATVSMEVTGRDTSYVKKVRVQAPDRPGAVALQVGSFTDSINAIRLKRGLSLGHGNVYIQETEVKGATYYRVRIGNYDSITAAMPTAEKLVQEGYPVAIMKADVKI